MEGFYIAIAIVVAAYLIADGLKNFGNPSSTSMMDMLDGEDGHELVKESEVHHVLGISKEDAHHLLQDHPEIPHIRINQTVYYPKEALRNWVTSIGDY